jgi:hypothetical protein
MSAPDDRHLQEVESMNQIFEILKPFEFEAQDRILTWVQIRIELDWDE